MSNDQAVSGHYTHGDLLKTIQAAIAKLGKTIDSVTIEDLAPVDEFHIGGRQATEHFLSNSTFPNKIIFSMWGAVWEALHGLLQTSTTIKFQELI